MNDVDQQAGHAAEGEENNDDNEESNDELEGSAVEGEQVFCDIRLARTICECIFSADKVLF